MRIVVVDTYYQRFLGLHYAANPGLEEASYQEQLTSLLEASFGTSDAYAYHLRELGHDAINLIVNCEPLQTAWAREHGLGRFSVWLGFRRGVERLRGNRPRTVFDAQIADFDPDVVFVHDMFSVDRERLQRLRGQGRFLVSQMASVLPAPEIYGSYDLLLSSFRHFVSRFREEGIDSEYFRIAFYDRILDRLRAQGVDSDPAGERPVDLSFIGGLNPAVYNAGSVFLERLAERFPLEVWGYDEDKLPAGSEVRSRCRGEVWGHDMYAVLARSRITINRHGEISEGQANNMRLFEATGTGAVLLTESAPNLSELFEPGLEVVAYDGEADLLDKVEGLLADDELRLRIAAAGQRRTLAEHTYRERMRELSGWLEERLAGGTPSAAISSNQSR